MNEIGESQAPLAPAPLWRRLLALLYDSLLLLGLWLVASALFLPFTGGEAVTRAHSPALFVLHRAVLVGVVVGFYGVFWTRQGHTLGMASWRLRVERDRTPAGLLSWSDVLCRLAAALLSWAVVGLGWLWCLVDARGRTWHDVLSGTRVVVVPKLPKSPR